MKVTKINLPKGPCNEYINGSLGKKLYNDYLFEKTFFEVVIEDVDPMSYLYRKMYETVYLRRYYTETSYVPENGIMEMKLSISEAIAFIKNVTPPAFQSRVEELFNSISSIEDSLKLFLVEEHSELDYHVGLFRKCTGLNYFETQSNYSFDRVKLLRSHNPSEPIVDFIHFDNIFDPGNVSLSEIYDGDVYGKESEDWNDGTLYRESTNVNVHLMFNCLRSKELEIVYDILTYSKNLPVNVPDVHILNVFKSDQYGYFVELFVEDYDCDSCNTIQTLFKSTYKGILKK